MVPPDGEPYCKRRDGHNLEDGRLQPHDVATVSGLHCAAPFPYIFLEIAAILLQRLHFS